MKNHQKKKLVSAVVILAVIGAILLLIDISPICVKCGQWHVVHNYYAAIGLRCKERRPEYEDVLAQLGKPDEIREIIIPNGTHRVVFDYTGFSLFFGPPRDENEIAGPFSYMEIYDSKYKLSPNIHVGSTREQVIRAYEQVTADPSAPFGTSFCDYKLNHGLFSNYGIVGTRRVGFEYDENNIVTMISYYPYWA